MKQPICSFGEALTLPATRRLVGSLLHKDPVLGVCHRIAADALFAESHDMLWEFSFHLRPMRSGR